MTITPVIGNGLKLGITSNDTFCIITVNGPTVEHCVDEIVSNNKTSPLRPKHCIKLKLVRLVLNQQRLL